MTAMKTKWTNQITYVTADHAVACREAGGGERGETLTLEQTEILELVEQLRAANVEYKRLRSEYEKANELASVHLRELETIGEKCRELDKQLQAKIRGAAE